MTLLCTIFAAYFESIRISKYELKVLKRSWMLAPICRFTVNLTASNTDRYILPDKQNAMSGVPILWFHFLKRWAILGKVLNKTKSSFTLIDKKWTAGKFGDIKTLQKIALCVTCKTPLGPDSDHSNQVFHVHGYPVECPKFTWDRRQSLLCRVTLCFWTPVSLDTPTKCQCGNPVTGITNTYPSYTKSHYHELGS